MNQKEHQIANRALSGLRKGIDVYKYRKINGFAFKNEQTKTKMADVNLDVLRPLVQKSKNAM